MDKPRPKDLSPQRKDSLKRNRIVEPNMTRGRESVGEAVWTVAGWAERGSEGLSTTRTLKTGHVSDQPPHVGENQP